MKKFLLLSLVLLFSLSSWAEQRSTEDATAIARSFFAQRTSTRSASDVNLVAVSTQLIQSASTRALNAEPSFYVFNQDQSAYVIISGDDRMKPVLGYSDSGSFATDNLPLNILGWLKSYDEVYTALNDGAQVVKEPKLLTRTTFAPTVAPLLGDINWDQGAPYNNACPIISGGRSVTGCVATAIAMIMKYHGYPARGKGSHTYTTRTAKAQVSFDFANAAFAWSSMLPQYNGNYTTSEADAVAQLMFACGVAVEMDYSPSGSGAYSHVVGQALIDYFGYDENLGYVRREYFTNAEWMNMIKTELSEGRPILYNGASKDVGHEFVFDGYDSEDMVHVNWGWGGSNNGFFEVSALNPDSPGIGGGTNLGGGFVMSQGMIVGFQPPASTSSFTSHFMVTNLKASKSSMQKNESFNVTINELYNMSVKFNGDLALIAEKDGKQTEINVVQFGEVPTHYGINSHTMNNVTIPTSFSDGTYAFYLATKDKRETSWSRVRGEYGYEAQFTLVVTGNNCTLTPFAGTLDLDRDLSGTIEVLHSLYSGRKGDFKMKLSNSSTKDEYFGLAGVMFITEDGEDALSLTGYSQLELKAGTTDQEFLVSGNLIANLTDEGAAIPAGNYYIVPGMQWGEYIYSIGTEQLVTVKAASLGNPILNYSNERLENDQLEVGELLKLRATLSLSGLGSLYDKTLMAAIFKVGSTSTNNLHYAEVFIEKGIPLEFEMDIAPNVSEGNYTINLYKPSLLGEYDGNAPMFRLNFSVGPATGIEDEVAASEGITIYQQPVDDVLYIRTNSQAKMITVYNLSGQQMVQQVEPSHNNSQEYSVTVGGLASGYYIVVLQSADGKVYRSKFIKR